MSECLHDSFLKMLQSPGLEMADASSFACRSFPTSRLTFCSYQVASCICLMSATASLSIPTLLPRGVQLVLPIYLRRFFENRHHYGSTKRTRYKKSPVSTNIPSIEAIEADLKSMPRFRGSGLSKARHLGCA